MLRAPFPSPPYLILCAPPCHGARVAHKKPTIRLSPEVVESFRATGSGWQTRMDAALKDWLKTHNPA